MDLERAVTVTLVLLFYTWPLGVIAHILMGRTLADRSTRKSLAKLRANVDVILRRGHAASKNEYLWLFQGACPRCCSRDIIEDRTSYSWPAPNTCSSWHSVTEERVDATCKEC